jgi:enoyl-CoA hydratase/carnithine racemase
MPEFTTLKTRTEGAVLFAEIDGPPINLIGTALVTDLVSLIELLDQGDRYRVVVFSSAVARLKSATDYERLVDRFGVRRSNGKFWSVYDAINSAHLANDPVRSGTLDLTRYALEQK